MRVVPARLMPEMTPKGEDWIDETFFAKKGHLYRLPQLFS
jgi:hypothetical protein